MTAGRNLAKAEAERKDRIRRVNYLETMLAILAMTLTATSGAALCAL